MSEQKTVRELVREGLEGGGYDGLCHINAECGCPLHDLFPCVGSNEPIPNCQAGYKRMMEDGDWGIFASKEPKP